jgi:hypothetical protein
MDISGPNARQLKPETAHIFAPGTDRWKAMIVFIGGMPRSGSTFSFNIARDLVERDGTVYQEPDSHLLDVVDRSAQSDHIVFKAHTADDTTIRLIQAGAVNDPQA